uniref:Methylamine/Aralkylamine dehydrogenase light chain C-terminal domain-containing protein n=1 Tax=Thermomicrobium roseum TaxID=500 RepID=A0A7C2B2P0_THERO
MSTLATALVNLLVPLPANAQLTCSDWRFCGHCGCRCTCRGGGDSTCPSGSSPGGAWYVCCRDTQGRFWLVRYRDCCRPRQPGETSCPSPLSGCPSSCACQDGCPQPHWCPTGYCAVCTQTQIWATC